MMRVAIVDDEPLARSGVIARLARCPDIEVVAEYADGASALEGLKATQPDLIFVDVQMPMLNGLDLIAAIAPVARPMAILLTAYDSFALRAFALNVVDYLLKPIDEGRFFEALERARQARPYRLLHAIPAAPKASASYIESFTVRVGSRLLFIKADDVDWIGADGDYACLHVGEREHLVRESLHRLSQQLDPAHFVRVHRSTIVRVDQVGELHSLPNRDAMLRLKCGTPLRASRTYIETLLDALGHN